MGVGTPSEMEETEKHWPAFPKPSETQLVHLYRAILVLHFKNDALFEEMLWKLLNSYDQARSDIIDYYYKMALDVINCNVNAHSLRPNDDPSRS